MKHLLTNLEIRGNFFLCSLLILILAVGPTARGQDTLHSPSIAEVLSLQQTGGTYISPDGKHVAFTKTRTDWKNNRYDTEIWLSKNGETPFQLTQNPEGSSNSPVWTPDSKWICFKSNRGENSQLFALSIEGGEAHQLSHEKQSIGSYAWSPDGTQLAYLLTEEKSKQDKKKEEVWGEFAVDEQEYTNSHLWVLETSLPATDPSNWPCLMADSSDCREWPKAKQLTKGNFHVTNFAWSPTGERIMVQHQPNGNLLSFFEADISLYTFESDSLQTLINNPSSDDFLAWAPDGRTILFSSDLANDSSNFYTNSQVFSLSLENLTQHQILESFDENPFNFSWTPKGIFFRANQKTTTRLFHLTHPDSTFAEVPLNMTLVGGTSFSKDGEKMTFSASTGEDLYEIYSSSFPDLGIKKLTQQSHQIEKWKVAKSEVVSWTSKDGRKIEGILHKPMDYDPAKMYPLLVRIHGGPTGVDRPSPVPAYVYPALQWLDKGCLILRPNYRGSAGYGAEFRASNVRNLGVGDAWDVLSGVDYLADQGIIDTSKMGAMGWSQGGYISAFLTTTSNRFKAISVGAGISDWMTYYVNTDIHPFTRQYLKGEPWNDPEIYAKTSPMTYIKQASTPTLIQHGEFDQRVPIPNAYQLYQGLEDVGVEAELIVYKGFGHGITKPKERLAASWHNYRWFMRHVWGEEVEAPYLKVSEEKDAKD